MILRNRDFTAATPPGFTATEMVGPDFSVWTISKAGQPYVGVYAGNHPQAGGGRPVPAGDRAIETGRRGTAYLHVWDHDLPPEEAEVARRILQSVAAVPEAPGMPPPPAPTPPDSHLQGAGGQQAAGLRRG